MSKHLKYLLFIVLAFILWNCDDNNENEPNNPSYNADYYVKYEATVTSGYIGNSIKYSVNTENGIQTFQSGKSFSQIFGPFKKGFTSSITADASRWHQADCDVKIYVCRGNEPFALKANNSGGKSVTVSYTIDY